MFCVKEYPGLSYPNLLGANRALQNPDVRALANLAELAGVDLRIVLLVRHPASVVRSGLRRGYEKSGLIHAIKMYTSTLSLLSSQLSLLDPSFIACWRYEAPTAGISDLVSFMGAQEEKPGDLKRLIAGSYRGKKKNAASAGSKLADEALQTASALHNEILAKYCKPRLARSGHWQWSVPETDCQTLLACWSILYDMTMSPTTGGEVPQQAGEFRTRTRANLSCLLKEVPAVPGCGAVVPWCLLNPFPWWHLCEL